MSILYLILSLACLLIGIQFLRGKWLKLLIHRSATPEAKRRQNAEIIAPGIVSLGIGFFCFGFFKAAIWLTVGNVIFLLSIAYIVIFALVMFVNANRK